MEELLRLAVERRNGLTVVRACGEIDMGSAPLLHAQLAEIDGDVLIDLAKVTFLDSSGMAALVTSRKRLIEHGGSLALRAPTGLVRTALELVGLADWIEGKAQSARSDAESDVNSTDSRARKGDAP